MKINKSAKLRLQQLADENGGILTPDAVVQDAKDKHSPLHSLFEWDTKRAAMRHWVDTAREIIRSVEVRVTINHVTVSAPYYVQDPNKDPGTQGYVAVSGLRSDHDAARIAIVNEFQRAADYLRRARNLAAALEMSEEVDSIISVISDLRDRVLHHQPDAVM